MRKKQQTTEHEDSHGHRIITHHAPAALLRAETNVIKLGDIAIYIYIYIYYNE